MGQGMPRFLQQLLLAKLSFPVEALSPGPLVGTAKDSCQPATVTTRAFSSGLMGFGEWIGTTSPRVACVATK